MANRVRVAVRCRPLNDRERAKDAQECVIMEDRRCSITDAVTKQQHQFAFDFCYTHTGNLAEEQKLIYEDLGRDVLMQAVQGYNVTVLAYGQTGAGKSLTMVGRPRTGEEDHRGLIPRIAEELFDGKTTVTRGEGMVMAKVHLRMLEIYNEQVKDLLAAPREGKPAVLKVREDPSTGPYVEGLSRHEVSSYDQVAEKMEMGLQARSIAATNMNSGSSRAHTICQLEYTRTNLTSLSEAATEKTAIINLVDLAGSERTGEAGTADNHTRMKESVNINKSLTALGQCIRALSDGGGKAKGKHVSYRDSTLTWLLKNSLGGNAKTIMIAALSPGSTEYHETLSTLRYADRMQRVQTAAVVNKKSVAAIPPKQAAAPPGEPCVTNAPEDDCLQKSPRGVLGVDYTIGEDISDDSDFSDQDEDLGFEPRGARAKGAGKVNLGQVLHLGNAGIGNRPAPLNARRTPLAAYGNPHGNGKVPPKRVKPPTSRAGPKKPPAGGAGKQGSSPVDGKRAARVSECPGGVRRVGSYSAMENNKDDGGRRSSVSRHCDWSMQKDEALSMSQSKDDLFITLKRTSKFYF